MADENSPSQKGKKQPKAKPKVTKAKAAAEGAEKLSGEQITKAYQNLLSLEGSFNKLKKNLERSGVDPEIAEDLLEVVTPIPKEEQPVCRDLSGVDFFQRLDFRKIRLGIRRKLWFIMFCALIAAGASSVMAYGLSKSTRATALLMYVEPPLAANQSLESTLMASPLNIQTLAEMVKLPKHLDAVRAVLGLEIDNETLSSMIRVVSSRTSNLLQIVCTADHPGLAIDVANALARINVQESLSRYYEHAKGVFSYYKEEEDLARGRLDQHTRDITEFKTEAKLFEMDLESRSATQNVSDLQKQYQASVIEYEELLVEYENLQREKNKLPDHVVRYEYDENPLKARVSHKEMSLLEARTKYGPQNPKVQLLEEEIRQLRAALSESTFDDSREQVFERNFVKEQLGVELMRLRGKLRASNKKKQSLEEALVVADQRFEEVPREQLEYARLLRNANTASDEIETLNSTVRLAESVLETNKTDLQIHELAVGAEPAKTLLVRLLPTIGFIAGGILGLFFVMIAEINDAKLRTPSEIKKYYGVPYLLSIPQLSLRNKRTADEKLIFYTRTLSERLSQLVHEKPFSSIVFTSAKKGEGKSTLAFHLARYYKRLGMKVVYVDFDGSSNKYIDSEVVQAATIDQYLKGAADFEGIITQADIDLMKGGVDPNMKELIKSDKMKELWEKLEHSYDMVVVDAPGVIDNHAAVNLAAMGDLSLYVIGSSKVSKDFVDSSLNELEESGAAPHGLILTQVLSSYVEDPLIKTHMKRKSWWSS